MLSTGRRLAPAGRGDKRAPAFLSRARRYIAASAVERGPEVRMDMAGETAWVPGAGGVRLQPIGAAPPEAIEALLDLAFGADRHGRTAYRLRAGVAPEPAASCTAFDEHDRLVGSLQSWPLALTGPKGAVTPLWLVGPIAVHPSRRSQGIGRAMLRRALAAIDRTPYSAVLIGDPDYYAPFGFSAVATGGWALPGPVERHRLLARTEEGAELPREGMLGPRAAGA